MERKELIRPQVLLYRRDHQSTGVVITQSGAMKSLLWVLSILTVGMLFVVFTIRYKQSIPARGVLEAYNPSLKIVAPQRAMVSEIFVTEGQAVSSGDILAVLSNEVLNGSGLKPEEVSIAQIETKIALIKKAMALSDEIHIAKKKRLETSIDLTERKLKSLNEGVLLNSERLEVSSANLKSFSQLLPSSSISRLQHNQQKLQQIAAAESFNNIEFKKIETEAALQDQRLEAQTTQLQYLVAEAEYEEQLGQLQQEIETLKNNHLIRIVSGGDGVVSGLAIKKGMAVLANQYLMQVSDTSNSIVATVFVPSQIVGKLYTEQVVRLSFDAFPVNQYGYYDASIVEIGGTPIDPRETSLPISSSNQAVFKITAELRNNYVEGPQTYPLRDGYEFTAHFVTENLSLLEFALKPLIALREKNK